MNETKIYVVNFCTKPRKKSDFQNIHSPCKSIPIEVIVESNYYYYTVFYAFHLIHLERLQRDAYKEWYMHIFMQNIIIFLHTK